MNRRLFLSTLFPKRKRLDKMRYKRTKLTKKDIKYTSGGIVKLIKEDPGAPISISVIESRGVTGCPPVNDCKSLLKEEVAKDMRNQLDKDTMDCGRYIWKYKEDKVNKEYWMVGKLIKYYKEGSRWEWYGLYDSEEKAVARCRTKDYFVGPVILNEEIPDEPREWPGGYYPLAGMKEKSMETIPADAEAIHKEDGTTKAWTEKGTVTLMNGVSDDGE